MIGRVAPRPIWRLFAAAVAAAQACGLRGGWYQRVLVYVSVHACACMKARL